MTSLRFQDPVMCLLLIPLFLAVLFAVVRQQRSAVLYSSVQVLKTLPKTFALRIKRLLPWVRFLGMALVILALARPQHGREEFRVRTEGIAIEMAIDRSGSMRAMDFDLDGEPANRLEVVRKVFQDFITGGGELEGRPDDLIGIIAFGGYADSMCPLTLDHGALLQVLETVQIPEQVYDARDRPLLSNQMLELELATAIGDAVALGVERLKDQTAKSKVLILLSDGTQTVDSIMPAEAAEAAKTFGVKIYSIGVGRNEPVPFPVMDPFGNVAYRSIRIPFDEKTLKMLADTTGGQYFHARDTETLRKVYEEIDRLEKTETEGRLYTEYRELFQYTLLPGLALILLELLLTATRFRSLP